MRIFAFITVIAIGWMVHAGVFFQTGNQWFQSCWTEQNGNRKPVTPEESIAWSKCESVTKRAVFSSGFVPSVNPEYAITPETKALTGVCPSNYSDIAGDGSMKYLAVPLVVKIGGPTLIDKFTPPDAMIERAFQARWPNCQAVAKANGFPKIVLRDGKWEFESSCKPCEIYNLVRGWTPVGQ
jgi:hypothetical protein